MEECKKYIFKIDDPATSVSILKLKLKTFLLNEQLLGDAEIGVKKLSNYKAGQIIYNIYFLFIYFFINFNHKILHFCFKIIIIFEKQLPHHNIKNMNQFRF